MPIAWFSSPLVDMQSDLPPASHRPKMTRHYNEAGLTFVPNFVLPVPPEASGA